jgi:osmoprotectant transport system substrate-binding protein
LPGDLKATGTMTVGSANFAESELVGQIYAKALKAAGVDVTFKDSVGNRQVTMPLMDKGDLDLMPEFTYSLLAYLNPKATPSNDLDAVTTQLKEALPKSLSVRKPTDVSDVNVFVVTAATAKKYHLKTLSDLAKVSDDLTLGGPPECPKNAQCIPGLKKVYGLNFKVK